MGTLLFTAAAAGSSLIGDVEEPEVALIPVLVALVAAFALAECFVFHVEFRREAMSFSISEVPTAFAIVFLPLHLALLARLLGGVIALVVVYRSSWFKVFFNAGLWSFEVVLARSVLLVVTGGNLGHGPRIIGGCVIALMISTIVGSFFTMLAVAMFEGRLGERIGSEFGFTVLVATMSSVVGALAVSISGESWWLVLLPLVPIVGVWAVMRAHGRTSQRVRDLEELHQLTHVVGRSLHREEVATVAIAEVRRLLRADRAALVLFDAAVAKPVVVAEAGRPFLGLPQRLDDPLWSMSLSAASLVNEPSVVAGSVAPGSVGEAIIAAPVRDDQGVVGMLLVGDRIGAADSFDDSDAIRAGAIADRLGLALRNATLHEQIEHEAWRDQLTGLPNRTLLDRRLDEVLTSSSVESVAVLAVGLDRFREVNSTLGHTVGDTVLTELAARLGAMGGSTELVARVSGDEFAVMAHAASASDAMSLARRVQDTVHAPFLIAGLEISVNTSVGVAVGAPGETSASLLLRQADMAMQWAKANHTNVELFRDEIDSSAPERLSMLAELRTALDQNQLEAFFQPKLDLATGTIVGAEALVRWNHPSKGLIAPAEFVQLAENTGLITTLTDQVIRRTVSAIRLLTDLGFRLDISVNLSTIDLLDDTIVERVERILADAGVLPGQLTLEITETSLLADGARTLATVEALHRMGSKLSIDDFGTGFSSLSYLRTLPASELKVDRSFVSNLVLDERDEVIVRSTIDLGHNLGLRVVAEGVEDSGTLDRLRMLGCDAAQGYGISRPLPLDRLLVWLNSCTFPVARTAAADERSSGQDLSRPAGTVRPIRSVR